MLRVFPISGNCRDPQAKLEFVVVIVSFLHHNHDSAYFIHKCKGKVNIDRFRFSFIKLVARKLKIKKLNKQWSTVQQNNTIQDKK